MRDTAYSCVVDSHPTFYFQSLVWLGTLIHRAGVARADIHVHLTESCDALVQETYEALGVNTARVVPFSRDHGHCNKIRQLASPVLRQYARVILCDCDIAFDRDIAGDLSGIALGAKIVDLPNPPVPVLLAVLEASGIPWRPARVATTFVQDGSRFELTRGRDTGDGAATLENNCNGGLYVIDRALWDDLGRTWAHWAAWLARRSELLAGWRVHIDQVSFALATWDLRQRVTPLGLAYNCPLHLGGAWCDDLPTVPAVLHFHTCFDGSGRIVWPGRTVESGVVRRANGAVDRLLAELERDRPSLYRALARRRARWLQKVRP